MSCTRNKTFRKLCELTSGDRFLWVVKGRPMVTNIFEVPDPEGGSPSQHSLGSFRSFRRLDTQIEKRDFDVVHRKTGEVLHRVRWV